MKALLDENQLRAMNSLKNGSVLCGGVGSGKSRTAIAYYFEKVCGGSLQGKKMTKIKDLYIITTARKRDTLEWEHEILPFFELDKQFNDISITVDSWNNIMKYVFIENAFFIFDEQRVVGYGKWTKSFLRITKHNEWILLSATPGDTWSDYIPLFIANGYFKNKTEFVTNHVIYSRFTKYPKIDRYINCGILLKYRNDILVDIEYKRKTSAHKETFISEYDKSMYNTITVKRWNVFDNAPVNDISQLCYLERRVVNTDPSRIEIINRIFNEYKKIIIFYNFDYELELLRIFCKENDICYAEWNGHKHEMIPKCNSWIYLVQYTAGAEGWNCIETNVMIFYSLNYSYKIMVQSAGRIDRRNTPFVDLYYFYIRSNSRIDRSIERALINKRDFNTRKYLTRYK